MSTTVVSGSWATGRSFDLEILGVVTLADLDADLLARTLKSYGISITEEKLETRHILTRYQGKVVASNAGIVLYGTDALRPRYFADARIDGARFAETTKAASIEDIFDPDEEFEPPDGIHRRRAGHRPLYAPP